MSGVGQQPSEGGLDSLSHFNAAEIGSKTGATRHGMSAIYYEQTCERRKRPGASDCACLKYMSYGVPPDMTSDKMSEIRHLPWHGTTAMSACSAPPPNW
jgi:hypothetical protein